MGSKQLTWVLGDLSTREAALQTDLDQLLTRAGWGTTLSHNGESPTALNLVWAPLGLTDSRQDALTTEASAGHPTILLGRSLTG